MLELPPLSLYIHIPWCVRKCPYCDFNSHEIDGDLPQERYVEALCEDLAGEVERTGGRTLTSIFIGGGTPSLFEADAFARLLEYIRTHFELADNIEITLEANPGTVEVQRFAAYRELGINRLSLGIQSFDDLQLQKLGRIHDREQAHKAIAIAREAGFENFNLDLMHGLPGQRTEDALTDLQTAIGYEPGHLSWYQLTIEPNTVFYRRPPSLPGEGLLEEIQKQGQSLLREHGFSQYEVSAYARPGLVSLHNHNYWCFGDYIGIGAGAHGKLSFPEHDRLIRTRKLKQPPHYLAASEGRDAEVIEIARDERALEFLMNALRLRKGFSTAQFEGGTGLPFSTISNRVEYLVETGLMATDQRFNDRFYAASEQGYRFLNSLLEEFI